MIFKWLVREIRNNLSFNIFFVLNLSLGLVGFGALNAFKISLDSVLQENSKNFLSADLAVSSRRPISDTDIQKVRQIISPQAEGQLWEMFSMVRTEQGSRLVQVKAIDSTYPFYGELILGSGRKIGSKSEKDIATADKVWVYPELLDLLGVKVGSTIRLGDRDFVIADTVVEDTTQTFRLASLAPKLYVSIEGVQKTSLVTFGSTMTKSWLYKLPADADTSALVTKLYAALPDPAIQIDTPQNASEDTGRALKYLSDYLGLVALVALFLSALGTGYLFRNFVSMKLYSIAVLNSLGLSKAKAQLLYLLQLAVLGAFASLCSLLLASVVFPVLTGVLREFSPLDIPLRITAQTIWVSFALGTFGSVLIGIPYLIPLNRLQTSQLFQEDSILKFQAKTKDFLFLVPSILAYWGLAVWQAHSLKIGSLFFAGWASSLVVMAVLGVFLLKSLKRVPRKTRWFVRHAVLSLVRKPQGSMIGFVAIALGTLLLSLIPQLQVSLKEELEAPSNITLPSLFMFDIQEEQLAGLEKLIQSQGLQLANTSAMVRARLLNINGQSFERDLSQSALSTREQEVERRSRNRGFNLSYREGLSSAETLVKGSPLSKVFDSARALAELSIEERFAERLGLKLEDILEFDIQGINVKGQVTNLRKVKWNSFQPNFFIIFQPGVLEEAPKTFLASLGKISKEQKEQIQLSIVKEFPNISIVDVARTMRRVFEISERMSWSLRLMALLSLLAGFVVLYSMVSQQAQERRWDLNMFKILGAPARQVHRLVVVEFFTLSTAAALFGTIGSWILTYTLASFLFEGNYKFDLQGSILRALAVVAVGVLVAYFASLKVAREKPASLLSNRQL